MNRVDRNLVNEVEKLSAKEQKITIMKSSQAEKLSSSVSQVHSELSDIDDPNKVQAILAYIARIKAPAHHHTKTLSVNVSYDNISNDEFESLLDDVTPKTHDEMNDISLLNIAEISNIKLYVKKNKQGKYKLPVLIWPLNIFHLTFQYDIQFDFFFRNDTKKNCPHVLGWLDFFHSDYIVKIKVRVFSNFQQNTHKL